MPLLIRSEASPHDFAIATQLGAKRSGARIRDFIDGMLNTASRRLGIETCDGGLVACTRSIDDYHRDFLKATLKAVIGHTWTDEEDAIRAATRHLGFRRTGPKISKAFKSAINGLLSTDSQLAIEEKRIRNASVYSCRSSSARPVRIFSPKPHVPPFDSRQTTP
jgi:hypothetical protein